MAMFPLMVKSRWGHQSKRDFTKKARKQGQKANKVPATSKMFHLAFYNKITKANETISWRNFYFDDDIEAYNNMYSYIKNTNDKDNQTSNEKNKGMKLL